MFGDNNAPQTDAPQSDNNMMQSNPMSAAPMDSVAPATPTHDTAGEYMLEDGTPATSAPVDVTTPTSNDIVSASSVPAPDTSADELLDLKQQALQQLSPLLGHLEQSPEEKFRTTMMLIQASDNDSLLKQAFEAANAITDDKAKAQALLDVVNEINYFTQHAEQQ